MKEFINIISFKKHSLKDDSHYYKKSSYDDYYDPMPFYNDYPKYKYSHKKRKEKIPKTTETIDGIPINIYSSIFDKSAISKAFKEYAEEVMKEIASQPKKIPMEIIEIQ